MGQNRRPGIYVPMPKSEGYGGNLRDELVQKFGDATVTRAETAVIVNILIYMGVMKAAEFREMITTMCTKIDDERRRAAGIRD